jgi:hypothetical protein
LNFPCESAPFLSIRLRLRTLEFGITWHPVLPGSVPENATQDAKTFSGFAEGLDFTGDSEFAGRFPECRAKQFRECLILP